MSQMCRNTVSNLRYHLLKKKKNQQKNLMSQPDPVHLCAWNCFLLATSTIAVSGHRRPRGLFYTFMPSFMTLWIQLPLPFCDVDLKWSWYSGMLQRCKGLNTSPTVTCCSALPWYRRRLWGVGGRGSESQRTASSPALCFPFFLTAGPSYFTGVEGSCSLLSSLQMNAPLFAARYGGLVYGWIAAWVWYDFSLFSLGSYTGSSGKLANLRKNSLFLLILQSEAVHPGTGILFGGVRPWLLGDDGASLNHHWKIWLCRGLVA